MPQQAPLRNLLGMLAKLVEECCVLILHIGSAFSLDDPADREKGHTVFSGHLPPGLTISHAATPLPHLGLGKCCVGVHLACKSILHLGTSSSRRRTYLRASLRLLGGHGSNQLISARAVGHYSLPRVAPASLSLHARDGPQCTSILTFRPCYRDRLLRKIFQFPKLRFILVSFAILRLFLG